MNIKLSTKTAPFNAIRHLRCILRKYSAPNYPNKSKKWMTFVFECALPVCSQIPPPLSEIASLFNGRLLGERAYSSFTNSANSSTALNSK